MTLWGHDFPGASLSILTSAQLFPQGLPWGLWCPWAQAEPKGAGKAVKRRWRSLGGRGRGRRRQKGGSVGSLAEATDPFQVNCAPPLVPQQALPGGLTGRWRLVGWIRQGVQRKPPPTPTCLLCQTQQRDISSSLIGPVSQGRGFKVTQASTEEQLRTLLGSGRLLGPHGNGGSRPEVGLCRHQRRPEASLPGPTPHPPPQPSEKGLPPGLGPSKHPQP